MDATFRSKLEEALRAAYPDRGERILAAIERWFAEDPPESRICSLCDAEKFPQVAFYRGETQFHGGGRVNPPQLRLDIGDDTSRIHRENDVEDIDDLFDEVEDPATRIRPPSERVRPIIGTVANARLCETCAKSVAPSSQEATMVVSEAARAIRSHDPDAEWVVRALEAYVLGNECKLCDQHTETLIFGRAVIFCHDCQVLGAEYLARWRAGTL